MSGIDGGNGKKNEWKDYEKLLPDGHFIKDYMKWVSEKTDAYPEFNFVSALGLLSIAVKRNLFINIQPRGIYTNIWALCIGKSSWSRKSTALSLMDDVIKYSRLQDMKIPDDSSPEALTDELSECGQKYIIDPEVSSRFANWQKRYNQGTESFFCNLYDNPDYYRRRLRQSLQKHIELKNVYITFNGATTIRGITNHLTINAVESGFLPRFLVVWPERKKDMKDLGPISSDSDEKAEKMGRWIGWFNLLLESTGKITIDLDKDALALYNKAGRDVSLHIYENEEEEIEAFYFRGLVSALKIATLIKVGELYRRIKLAELTINKVNGAPVGSNKLNVLTANFVNFPNQNISLMPQVTVPFLKDFLRIDEKTLRYALDIVLHYFIPCSEKLVSEIRENRRGVDIEKVYQVIVKRGPIDHSNTLRYSHLSKWPFRQAIDTLFEAKMIKIEGKHGVPIYTAMEKERKKFDFKEDG